MAPVVIPGLNIPLLTGPLVLGYMWSYFLYGMLIVQVYMYCEAFPRDRFGLKALVWSMFVLETGFSILITIAAWNAFGPGWGDPDTLGELDWTWLVMLPLNAILAAMAQGFYSWRIWSLTNRRLWLPILIGCVMLTQVTAAFYSGIVIAIEGRSVPHLFALWSEITVWLSGSAACDLLITGSLVYILARHKRTSQYQHTTGLINSLIRFNVETGSITSIAALVEGTLWLSCREWNIHYIFFFILGRLYSNMLMATLNCRASNFQKASPAAITIPPSSFWAEPQIESGESMNLSLITRTGVNESRTTDGTTPEDAVVMTHFDSNTDVTVVRSELATSEKPSPHLVG
ncbi:hypothetical protein MVEN_01740400 [Mycena venus]|uniref:DUF6534 domain-containing protein n=1 Tax=Mycena venus TaxID=2733690 RepID=A0A8H6XMQ4_9AGAR|nr:hypothetical protein MVEN_01740400 [Mycena venus]